MIKFKGDSSINKSNQLLYKLLYCSLIMMILILTYFIVRVLNNGETIFKTFFYNLFNEPPIIGRLVHMYIKSLNIINLSIIYEVLVSKLINIELVYYVLLISICQVLISFLMYRLSKKPERYLNYFLSVVLLIVLILKPIYPPYILPIAFINTLSLVSMLIKCTFIFQFIIILKIGYNYFRENIFTFENIVNVIYLSRLIKRLSIIIISFLMIISMTYFISSKSVLILKDEVIIDYTINVEPTANNILSIEVSDELLSLASKLGVTIPETLEGGAILSYFDLDEINIGEILSNYILDMIDNLSYIYINHPLSNYVFISILMLIFVLLNLYLSLIIESALISNILQTVFMSYIYLFNLSSLGLIINVLGLFLLFLTVLKLIAVIRKLDENQINNIKSIRYYFEK